MLYIRSKTESGDDFVLEREPREHMMLPGLSRLAILIMIALLITPLLMPSMSFFVLWVISFALLSIAQVPSVSLVRECT